MSVPPESVIPPAPTDPAPGVPPPEERQWAMFAHLSALLGAILTGALGGGWGCFIGPLVIWLVKKDAMPFVNDQGKEALNFNITVAIAFVVLFLLSVMTLASAWSSRSRCGSSSASPGWCSPSLPRSRPTRA